MDVREKLVELLKVDACHAMGSGCECFPWCEHLVEDGIDESAV